jgi:hypothetical protein
LIAAGTAGLIVLSGAPRHHAPGVAQSVRGQSNSDLTAPEQPRSHILKKLGVGPAERATSSVEAQSIPDHAISPRAETAQPQTADPDNPQSPGEIGARAEERLMATAQPPVNNHKDATSTGAITSIPAENAPWWLVVASVPDGPGQELGLQRARAKLARCRLETLSDPSSKFAGFRTGYVAVVVGPFQTRPEATRVLEAARPCAGDANVRQARRAE